MITGALAAVTSRPELPLAPSFPPCADDTLRTTGLELSGVALPEVDRVAAGTPEIFFCCACKSAKDGLSCSTEGGFHAPGRMGRHGEEDLSALLTVTLANSA